MSDVIVAHMTKSDIPAVSEIVIEAFNKPPINESWTKETSTKHLEEVLDTDFSFVAKENGIVIGALVGNTSTEDKGLVYYIDILAVKESHRGHGIGEKLIAKAVETGRKHKITELGLESSARLRAFEWYKRLGFKESGWVELVKTLV